MTTHANSGDSFKLWLPSAFSIKKKKVIIKKETTNGSGVLKLFPEHFQTYSHHLLVSFC